MNTLVRVSWCLLVCCLFTLTSLAQVIFSASDLPSEAGQFVRGYFSTNVNLSSLIGQTNGAQRWDFSQGQQPNESIRRTDIVLPGDTGEAGSFPSAAYAERDTDEPNDQIAWRFYGPTNSGRLYFGSRNAGNSAVVFDAPTLDIPATVQYRQTWSRNVTWTEVFQFTIPLAYVFGANAEVDGCGTAILPTIGEVPALRVKEVHSYYAAAIMPPVPLVDQTNLYYYWLVPGLGVAAQVLCFGNNSLLPLPLSHTNEVLRVFASDYFTSQPSTGPVTGLHMELLNGEAVLGWNQTSNAGAYRVESANSLSMPNWQVLGRPSTNQWLEPASARQRFYRVFFGQ